MTAPSYILLIILTTLSMLGGISARELDITASLHVYPLIVGWAVLHLAGSRTMNWTADHFIPLAAGCVLIYTCGDVVQNPSLIPTVILTFGGSTFFALQYQAQGE